jgi:hypothetical protein
MEVKRLSPAIKGPIPLILTSRDDRPVPEMSIDRSRNVEAGVPEGSTNCSRNVVQRSCCVDGLADRALDAS